MLYIPNQNNVFIKVWTWIFKESLADAGCIKTILTGLRSSVSLCSTQALCWTVSLGNWKIQLKVQLFKVLTDHKSNSIPIYSPSTGSWAPEDWATLLTQTQAVVSDTWAMSAFSYRTEFLYCNLYKITKIRSKIYNTWKMSFKHECHYTILRR